MLINPLDQFKIKPIFDLSLYGYDISITNSSIFLIITALSILLYFLFSLKNKDIIPSKIQMSAEIIYNLASEMVTQNIGPKGKNVIPFILTLFMFIIISNLLGVFPYSFSTTSHVSITLPLAIIVFIKIIIIGLSTHGACFFKIFLPSGIPWWLSPLIVIIEFFVFLSRPATLALRLVSNIIAGHILLKVVAISLESISIYFKILPGVFSIIIIGFEIFVSILQGYIFAVLSCVYLNDAFNLH